MKTLNDTEPKKPVCDFHTVKSMPLPENSLNKLNLKLSIAEAIEFYNGNLAPPQYKEKQPHSHLQDMNIPELNKLLSILELNEQEKLECSRVLTRSRNELIIAPDGTLEAFSPSQLLVLLLQIPDAKRTSQVIFFSIPAIVGNKMFLGMIFTRFYCFKSNTGITKPLLLFLSDWMNSYPSHFDSQCDKALSTFLEQMPHLGQFKRIQDEVEQVQKSLDFVKSFVRPHIVQHPINAGKYTTPELFMKAVKQYGVETVAKQLILQDSKVFGNISNADIILMIYGKSTPESFKLMTKHFDILSNFVSFSILFYSKPKERSDIFQVWISIASIFYKSNNFFGLFYVVGALTSSPISRLHNTLALVWKEKFEMKPMFDTYSKIISIESNYGIYRSVLSRKPTPCIPFIACFQKDWIYFQETDKKRSDGLISYKKCEMAFTQIGKLIIADLEKGEGHKSNKYEIEEIPELFDLINGIQIDGSTMQFMKISQMLEPSH